MAITALHTAATGMRDLTGNNALIAGLPAGYQFYAPTAINNLAASWCFRRIDEASARTPGIPCTLAPASSSSFMSPACPP